MSGLTKSCTSGSGKRGSQLVEQADVTPSYLTEPRPGQNALTRTIYSCVLGQRNPIGEWSHVMPGVHFSNHNLPGLQLFEPTSRSGGQPGTGKAVRPTPLPSSPRGTLREAAPTCRGLDPSLESGTSKQVCRTGHAWPRKGKNPRCGESTVPRRFRVE